MEVILTMKLHDYLEDLLGNRVSISVLRTLVRNKGKIYTVRGLARDAGVSHPGTSKAVGDLERLGVVQIQPVGRSHQVTLNQKSHLLKKIIEPIFAVEEQTLDQAVLTLKRHLDTREITSAAVFGSVSRGRERQNSDIDVFVISNDYDGAIAAISDARDEIFAKFHGNASPLVFSTSEFKSKRKSELVRSILKNHTMICGKSLESVLK